MGAAQGGGGDTANQAETRHRVANVFQFLSALTRLRRQRAQEPDSQRHLGWMLDMMSALAALQQRLLSPGGEDFALYLDDMAGQWRRRCAGRPITVELAAEPLDIPESRASALALIASEWVANAIAHGFPGERPGVIRIELARLDDERAVLSVSDDGQGYDPQTVDKARLGLWLVSGLVAQVRGHLATTIDDGVRCRLEFPAPVER